MPVFLSFVAGYVLGTRAGKERYAELCAAWKSISTSETVRTMLADTSGMAISTARTMLKLARK